MGFNFGLAGTGLIKGYQDQEDRQRRQEKEDLDAEEAVKDRAQKQKDRDYTEKERGRKDAMNAYLDSDEGKESIKLLQKTKADYAQGLQKDKESLRVVDAIHQGALTGNEEFFKSAGATDWRNLEESDDYMIVTFPGKDGQPDEHVIPKGIKDRDTAAAISAYATNMYRNKRFDDLAELDPFELQNRMELSAKGGLQKLKNGKDGEKPVTAKDLTQQIYSIEKIKTNIYKESAPIQEQVESLKSKITEAEGMLWGGGKIIKKLKPELKVIESQLNEKNMTKDKLKAISDKLINTLSNMQGLGSEPTENNSSANQTFGNSALTGGSNKKPSNKDLLKSKINASLTGRR